MAANAGNAAAERIKAMHLVSCCVELDSMLHCLTCILTLPSLGAQGHVSLQLTKPA